MTRSCERTRLAQTSALDKGASAPGEGDVAPTGVRKPSLSIYRHMLRGSFWAVALIWALRGIGLINTVILARLLAPADFGLVAMASLALGLLETFVNLGSGFLLIRQPV